ncbi:MAG: hypothetical protein IJE43_15935 [Alphaproteobacteria bacterium]|nr:hypothetical protein [Alphaproteobacteria bacterium]
MFVEIDNNYASAIDIDVEMRKLRNAQGGISAIQAMQFLKKTNHIANIKFIIKEIKKLSKEDRWYYKSFVLSAIERREHAKSVYEDLRALAVEGGYEDEFLVADYHTKVYLPTDCKFYKINDNNAHELEECIKKNIRCVVSFAGKRSMVDLSGLDLKMVAHLSLHKTRVSFDRAKNIPPYTDLSDCSGIKFGECDLSRFSNFNFAWGTAVRFRRDYNFPDDTNFCNAHSVIFEDCDLRRMDNVSIVKKGDFNNVKLPDAIYLYPHAEVRFADCDFSTVKEMSYTSGIIHTKEIAFVRCCNLPKVLDLSMSEYVIFYDTDLKGVKKIKFCVGKRICLTGAYNFPEVLSFPPLTNLNSVCLNDCDLNGVKKLEFSPKSSVEFERAKNLPENLDLSNCYRVDLIEADLTGVKNIKFGKGTVVVLRKAKNLPEFLDFSMCEHVYLDDTCLENVKKIKFESKEQEKNILKGINYKGRTIWDNNIIKRIFKGRSDM